MSPSGFTSKAKQKGQETRRQKEADFAGLEVWFLLAKLFRFDDDLDSSGCQGDGGGFLANSPQKCRRPIRGVCILLPYLQKTLVVVICTGGAGAPEKAFGEEKPVAVAPALFDRREGAVSAETGEAVLGDETTD
ncbi:hypothetical protein CCM_01366 [Cordyceps militaris CM01]|uniref:Uncharacterized protein n=1 Tax=Cordyceps militaris (strain CM01) TaxID=983644 RepID=G3J4P3_CORMM|nr:uncharacterized protein CCM_01366 [Cordyceps militaris CM01]EGX96708.1 hypothetical protein CCM_01366 [Cordyceps militaris CM01]